MEEDYYSDDDEKVEATVNIYYTNKIKSILKNAKNFIKKIMSNILFI